MTKFSALFLALIAILLLITVRAQDTPNTTETKDCEVCAGLISRIETIVRDENIKDVEKIENLIFKTCKTVTHPREKRLCWYLGAAKDSATNIIREVSKPLSFGVPAATICEKRLKKKDSAICSLRYEGSSVIDDTQKEEPKAFRPKPKPKPKPTIDFNGLNKLKIKDLKEILASNSLDCDGCTEKGDYIRKIKTLQNKDEL
jgi:hypothetical protein